MYLTGYDDVIHGQFTECSVEGRVPADKRTCGSLVRPRQCLVLPNLDVGRVGRGGSQNYQKALESGAPPQAEPISCSEPGAPSMKTHSIISYMAEQSLAKLSSDRKGRKQVEPNGERFIPVIASVHRSLGIFVDKTTRKV